MDDEFAKHMPFEEIEDESDAELPNLNDLVKHPVDSPYAHGVSPQKKSHNKQGNSFNQFQKFVKKFQAVQSSQGKSNTINEFIRSFDEDSDLPNISYDHEPTLYSRQSSFSHPLSKDQPHSPLYQGFNSQDLNSQSHNSQGFNSQSNSQGLASQNRNSRAPDSQSRKSRGLDSQSRKSRGLDSQSQSDNTPVGRPYAFGLRSEFVDPRPPRVVDFSSFLEVEEDDEYSQIPQTKERFWLDPSVSLSWMPSSDQPLSEKDKPDSSLEPSEPAEIQRGIEEAFQRLRAFDELEHFLDDVWGTPIWAPRDFESTKKSGDDFCNTNTPSQITNESTSTPNAFSSSTRKTARGHSPVRPSFFEGRFDSSPKLPRKSRVSWSSRAEASRKLPLRNKFRRATNHSLEMFVQRDQFNAKIFRSHFALYSSRYRRQWLKRRDQSLPPPETRPFLLGEEKFDNPDVPYSIEEVRRRLARLRRRIQRATVPYGSHKTVDMSKLDEDLSLGESSSFSHESAEEACLSEELTNDPSYLEFMTEQDERATFNLAHEFNQQLQAQASIMSIPRTWRPTESQLKAAWNASPSNQNQENQNQENQNQENQNQENQNQENQNQENQNQGTKKQNTWADAFADQTGKKRRRRKRRLQLFHVLRPGRRVLFTRMFSAIKDAKHKLNYFHPSDLNREPPKFIDFFHPQERFLTTIPEEIGIDVDQVPFHDMHDSDSFSISSQVEDEPSAKKPGLGELPLPPIDAIFQPAVVRKVQKIIHTEFSQMPGYDPEGWLKIFSPDLSERENAWRNLENTVQTWGQDEKYKKVLDKINRISEKARSMGLLATPEEARREAEELRDWMIERGRDLNDRQQLLEAAAEMQHEQMLKWRRNREVSDSDYSWDSVDELINAAGIRDVWGEELLNDPKEILENDSGDSDPESTERFLEMRSKLTNDMPFAQFLKSMQTQLPVRKHIPLKVRQSFASDIEKSVIDLFSPESIAEILDEYCSEMPAQERESLLEEVAAKKWMKADVDPEEAQKAKRWFLHYTRKVFVREIRDTMLEQLEKANEKSENEPSPLERHLRLYLDVNQMFMPPARSAFELQDSYIRASSPPLITFIMQKFRYYQKLAPHLNGFNIMIGMIKKFKNLDPRKKEVYYRSWWQAQKRLGKLMKSKMRDFSKFFSNRFQNFVTENLRIKKGQMPDEPLPLIYRALYKDWKKLSPRERRMYSNHSNAPFNPYVKGAPNPYNLFEQWL